MLAVKVEGVYESDIGTGQKKYVDFNYTIKTSRLTENGIVTHIAKRFIPMLVANDKTKKEFFSRLRSFNILNIEHIEDDKDCIIGKNINELDAGQIQDLACTFDLYDVPLYGKHTLSVIKEKAISSYLKKVWKIDLEERYPDGTLKYDLDEVVIEVPKNYLQKKENKSQKVKVSDFIKQSEQKNSETQNVIDESFNAENDSSNNGIFPSANVLASVGNLFKSKNEA